MTHAKAIWDELKLPRLAPQPPWHGYELGDWTADWTRYAEMAVEGRWRELGDATYARRRGGMKPETPVRSVGGEGGDDE